MDELIVRSFNAEDVHEIINLHRRFNRWFEESELSPDYVNQCSLRSDFRFFVAEYDKNVVGFSGVLFHESTGRAEVGPICISEEFQNMNVGSRLVEAVLDFLRQRGIHRITAKVKRENKLAIAFFEQNNFKREAVLSRYTKKGETAVQLTRFL
ncbi:MAG: GNAT family N-acetyltransferase [Candidatus Altiarchaeota archaeon]